MKRSWAQINAKERKYEQKGPADYMDERNEQPYEVEIEREKY